MTLRGKHSAGPPVAAGRALLPAYVLGGGERN
jgi:hypothetical protein